jgi:hypothetical protein
VSRSQSLSTFESNQQAGFESGEAVFLMDPDAVPDAVRIRLETGDSVTTTPLETQPSTAKHNGTATSEKLADPPTIWLRTPKPTPEYLLVLQKWEGTVLSRGRDSFQARLTNKNQVCPDEEAEILLDEVSEDDLPLVTPGAVFYWSIGYHVGTNKQKKRVSIIRFRRLPSWTEKELQQANEQADRLRDLLGWRE